MLRHLAFRARGKRILASSGVTFRGLDKIEVLDLLEVGMSYLGFMDRHDRTLLSVRGPLVFGRRFSIAKGCRFDIGQDARAEFGGGYVNARSTFAIMHGLDVGEGCAIGWGCSFLDEDFHVISYEGQKPAGDSRIVIGSHVWIGSSAAVLKGAVVPDGCVVASGCVVTGLCPANTPMSHSRTPARRRRRRQ